MSIPLNYYKITNQRIQMKKNIEPVTEQHTNSLMHVEHELIISVLSQVEYFSVFEFFD